MPLIRHVLNLGCVLLLACGSDSPPPQSLPDAFTVFPNLPIPPGATLVSKAGSSDALQLTMFSPARATGVVAYYRSVLSKGGWRLVSDRQKPDGTVVLYAEQDGPPMWVSVWPTSDSAGTMVQLAGVVLRKDSTKAAAQPGAAPKPKS
jgi:hypothetical protein